MFVKCLKWYGIFHFKFNVTQPKFPIYQSINQPVNQHKFVQRLLRRGGNGFGHINEVELRRAQLVSGLVTTFDGSTIPVFI